MSHIQVDSELLEKVALQLEQLSKKVDSLQTQLNPQPLTVSIFEASEIIGRSVSTLRGWIQDGRLKPISKLTQTTVDGKRTRSENLMFNRKDIVKLAEKVKSGRPRKAS